VRTDHEFYRLVIHSILASNLSLFFAKSKLRVPMFRSLIKMKSNAGVRHRGTGSSINLYTLKSKE
jgi:hypothetical protein